MTIKCSILHIFYNFPHHQQNNSCQFSSIFRLNSSPCIFFYLTIISKVPEVKENRKIETFVLATWAWMNAETFYRKLLDAIKVERHRDWHPSPTVKSGIRLHLFLSRSTCLRRTRRPLSAFCTRDKEVTRTSWLMLTGHKTKWPCRLWPIKWASRRGLFFWRSA